MKSRMQRLILFMPNDSHGALGDFPLRPCGVRGRWETSCSGNTIRPGISMLKRTPEGIAAGTLRRMTQRHGGTRPSKERGLVAC